MRKGIRTNRVNRKERMEYMDLEKAIYKISSEIYNNTEEIYDEEDMIEADDELKELIERIEDIVGEDDQWLEI